tara:strand:- start:236 stop:541 length:306 start_codon:yes stop_codon:yes gene_type:complete
MFRLSALRICILLNGNDQAFLEISRDCSWPGVILTMNAVFEDYCVKDHLGDVGEASYGFARCSKLSASERPLTNADSYALLAVACYITQCDCFDEFFRIPQ